MNWIDVIVAVGCGVSARLIAGILKIARLGVKLAFIGLAIVVALIFLQTMK